jgi:hypothetical protein
MGIYINGEDEAKISFLTTHGTEKARINCHPLPDVPLTWSFQDFRDANSLPICLVLNDGFMAAGIAWNQDEFNRFQLRGDPRARYWFALPNDIARNHIPTTLHEEIFG